MDCKAGMFVYALAFLAGVVCVQQLSVLPSYRQLFVIAGLLFAMLWFVHFASNQHINNPIYKIYLTLTISIILLIILGFVYSSLYAKQQLSYRVDETVIGQNFVVNGWVTGIPQSNGKVQRFEFNVESYQPLSTGKPSTTNALPRKIRLSWYYGKPVNAGQNWQFEVRLKPPHGFLNPGGFDYEAWLFQHGLHATGYVRKSLLNRQPHPFENSIGEITVMGAIDRFRQVLGQQIDRLSAQMSADEKREQNAINSYSLIKALAIGDKSGINRQQWQVLTSTGTSHLMAISGLHIGLAALFAYAVIRRLVPAPLMKYVPAQHIAIVGGMVAAFIYALVAGLSIPTQRAIIMLFVLSIMMLVRRNHRPLDSLGFALILVLIFDPLAVLSAGFWFSFSAVAVIFISLHGRQSSEDKVAMVLQKQSIWKKMLCFVCSVLKQWIRLQLIITLFLLPMSLFMFQQVSLVSPLVNLLLIPYVSFLVVPLVLLAIILTFLWQEGADMLLGLAAYMLDSIWPLLSYMAELPFALWVNGQVGITTLLAVTICMLLFYFAGDVSHFILGKRKNDSGLASLNRLIRLFASIIIILLLVSNQLIANTSDSERTDFKVTVLDVGQGSAAVLQTKNHTLVFDAGAKFSDKFDAGSGVVVPYLRSIGVTRLDLLIISHGDADHIGGAQAILEAYPLAKVLGQDLEYVSAIKKQNCYEGVKWQWDAVYFELLAPALKNMAELNANGRNNHSCVLRVKSSAGTVLFTGDIEKKAEQILLEQYTTQLKADVLMVPHHGSKTSSSRGFVSAVAPKFSVFSVGYKNRYKLPNNKIVARYRAQAGELLRTDNSGAITITLAREDGISFEKYRDSARRYWHHIME